MNNFKIVEPTENNLTIWNLLLKALKSSGNISPVLNLLEISLKSCEYIFIVLNL